MDKRILLIDDNPHILEAIELILTTENYNVHSLVKVDNVLKDVKKINPSLILLDLLLSGRSGKEITQILKADEATKNIPIIMISAHPSAEKSAMQAHADAFLAKPFDIDDLLNLVGKFTSSKSSK